MNPLPATDPGLAVLYRRVSSAEQVKGYGLDAQSVALDAFTAAEGLTVVGSYSDPGVSGTVPLDDRPGLSAALDAVLRTGAGALVVARHDRLARDTLTALLAERAFTAAGARVLYAEGGNGEDDSAVFMRTILHATAEQAKRELVRRLAAARDVKAAAHPGARAHGGRVPYGYRRTATALEIDPEQAEHVRRIFALVREGRSLGRVARTMTAETGREWSSVVVRRIAARDIYRRERPGRIIAPRHWGEAQVALAARSAAAKRAA